MIVFSVNGINLPVLESETGVRLNKKAFDVEEINRRYGDWSKTVSVPSNPESDALFGYLFDVNVNIRNTTNEQLAPDFNPNLKASCRIDVGGIPVIRGFCQLTKITIDSENKIVYNLNCYSNLKNFFEDIEPLYLEDLDFSEFNHVYDASEITGSWSYTDSDDSLFVYPMIDYGKQDQQLWSDFDFKPALFVKRYLDKIFKDAGYTYSSTFLNSDYFKKLIIPAEYNIQLSDTTIEGRQFYVSRSSTEQNVDCIPSITTTWASITEQLVFNTDTGSYYNTTGNKYSTTNGIFTPATWNGLYKFKGKIKGRLKYTGSNIPSIFSSASIMANTKLAVVLYDNNAANGIVVGAIAMNDFDFGSGALSTNDESSTITAYFETDNVRVKKFHSVYIVAFVPDVTARGIISSTITAARDFEFVLETTSEFGAVLVETTTAIGDTIEMNQVIPKEVKQKDFVVSLIEMFNLYCIPDPIIENKLIIETREDFFTDEKEDITGILDTSKPFEIHPMAMLRARRYEWSYQDDNDIDNKNYKFMWQEDYGMFRKDLENDFQYSTKKISVIFAPTPLVNYPSNTTVVGNDRIISAINFQDAKDGKNISKQRIRIIYWGGLLPTNMPYRFFTQDSGTIAYIQSNYPYAGHLDDPYDPEFDLCFGVPRSVFYDNVIGGIDKVAYTDGNLYNLYWRRWINEITDKNSKIITCHLKLNALDYSNLSFRKLYFIKDAVYRLLEVSDYDALGGSTTSCKFLKWNPRQQHFINRGSFNGGRDTIGGGNDISPGFMRVLTGNQLDRYADSFRLRPEDDAPYLRGFTYGESNKGGNVKASVIYGNNNELRGDNIVLINTNDRVAIGDEVWVNDVFLTRYETVVLTNAAIIQIYTTPIELLSPLPSNQYYKIIKVLSEYDYNGTAYGGGGEFVIYTDTSFNTLSSKNGAIAGTADRKDLWDLSPEVADWGQGLLISNNNAGDTEAGGTLTLKIYYQIIEL